MLMTSLRIFSLGALLLFCSSLHAQTQGTIFFDADWKVTTADNARFHRVWTRVGDSAYHIQDYYASGKPQMDGYASDTLDGVRFGAHKFYWETGDLWREGNMKLGVKDGLWTTYHIGGQKSEQGRFDLGRRQGEWNFWYPEGERQEQRYYVAGAMAGHCRKWFVSGELAAETTRFTDSSVTEWTYYFKRGKISARQMLDDRGKPSVRYWNEEGSELADTSQANRPPSFPGGREMAGNFIMERLRGLVIREEVEIKVMISILENGDVGPVRVIQGMDTVIAGKVVDAIASMPRWIPETEFNRPVQSMIVIPIILRP